MLLCDNRWGDTSTKEKDWLHGFGLLNEATFLKPNDTGYALGTGYGIDTPFALFAVHRAHLDYT